MRGTTAVGTPGVEAFRASRVTVTDANVGTTISDGAGVEVTVGVLGNRTWAAIAGNLYININDTAGALAGGTGVTVSA